MVNKQLLNYIRQQTQQGFSQEQIKNSLIANGWQPQDVEKGFDAIKTNTLKTYLSIFSTVTWKTTVGITIGIVILGGGIYFISQALFKTEELPETSEVVSDQPPVEEPSETTPQQPPEQTPQTEAQNQEIIFADKLSSCTEYKTTFEHLITGDILEKEILGIIDGKCNYLEQMPNGGMMECKFSESERIAVAQYYKNLAMAESFESSANIHISLEEVELETTFTIDGKVVDNPLQEVLNNGSCIVSGY